jgi:hypothetical protein
MGKCIKFAVGVLIGFVLSVCAAEVATGDTLGLIGNALSAALSKIKFPVESIVAIVGVLSMVAYRGTQILLQRLPTKWKWINNKLTLGIIDKIFVFLFGKTTALYNAKVEAMKMIDNEKASAALREVAAKHLSRHGGILKAFEDAMKNMND